MQIARRRLAAFLLVPALLLTGCGSDDGGDSEAEASPSPGPTVTTDAGVTVAGTQGSKPTVQVPEEDPPAELQVEVLAEGDGEAVEEGDLLVANYLGQTWADGTVFDNSYDRGQPAGFGIGVGQVIPGWDQGLVGQQIGSRVLLVIPPEHGYADQPPQGSGIEAGDTLVFVVDIEQRFDRDSAATGSAGPEPAADLPTVSAAPGEKPEVTIPEGAEAPAEPQSAVIIAGDGEPLNLENSLVAQVLQVDYASGETVYQTWGTAPLALVPEQVQQLPGLAAALEGQNVGTRVLIAAPPPAEGQNAAALVLDIVGAF